MSIFKSIFTGFLFFLFTPGIVYTLPTGGSKITVAATHAVVFGLAYLYNELWNKFEWGINDGFKVKAHKKPKCKSNDYRCFSGSKETRDCTC
jgi:hypothetical protein